MSNHGIGRARMFVGGFLLAAAVIVWGVGVMTNPYGETITEGTEHLRTTVLIYQRNSALATVVLSVIAAFLLFPPRRQRMPRRDWGIGIVIGLLVASSLYQLLWLLFGW